MYTYTSYPASDERFPNREMDMIAFAQRESDWKAWVDAYGRTSSDVEIATAKIPGDGSSLFLRQITLSFRWSECRRRSSSEGSVVIIIMLLRHVRCRMLNGEYLLWCGSKCCLHRRCFDFHRRNHQMVCLYAQSMESATWRVMSLIIVIRWIARRVRISA